MGIGKENIWVVLSGLVLLLFTLFILITVECISVNKEKRTIRLHSKYFSRGKTYSLYDYSHVVFTLDVDTSRAKAGRLNGSRSLHYEVYLIDGISNKLWLAEFPTQKESIKFMHLIATHTDLKTVEKWVPFHTLK